jgi:3-hydroxyanthranilate 3,4-dioxygenase
MSTSTVPLPFNLQEWIAKYLPQSLGAIGNKEVFKGSDFIFQIIKGPNARNDFHIDPWDEIFYQLKGHIFVHYIDENGQQQKVRIEEGGVFLLPKNVPHSPRRPPGSIGLVVERPRKQGELDGIAWFCEHCGNLLHKVEFWCEDIEVGIKEAIMAFNVNEELRTCKRCSAVLPDPTMIKHWQESSQ